MPKLHYASQVVGNLGDNLGSGVDTQGAYSSHASPARKIRDIFAQLLDFPLFSDLLALPGGARVVYVKQGLRNGTVSVRLSVRPSVPAWAYSSKPSAAGLLLWDRRAGDIDRLPPGAQQQRRAAGECG